MGRERRFRVPRTYVNLIEQDYNSTPRLHYNYNVLRRLLAVFAPTLRTLTVLNAHVTRGDRPWFRTSTPNAVVLPMLEHLHMRIDPTRRPEDYLTNVIVPNVDQLRTVRIVHETEWQPAQLRAATAMLHDAVDMPQMVRNAGRLTSFAHAHPVNATAFGRWPQLRSLNATVHYDANHEYMRLVQRLVAVAPAHLARVTLRTTPRRRNHEEFIDETFLLALKELVEVRATCVSIVQFQTWHTRSTVDTLRIDLHCTHYMVKNQLTAEAAIALALPPGARLVPDSRHSHSQTQPTNHRQLHVTITSTSLTPWQMHFASND